MACPEMHATVLHLAANVDHHEAGGEPRHVNAFASLARAYAHDPAASRSVLGQSPMADWIADVVEATPAAAIAGILRSLASRVLCCTPA